jgi:hypothetical protein
MLTATDLTTDGKLAAEAVAAAQPAASDLVAALAGAEGMHLAALAIIAGERAIGEAAPPLLARLDRDGTAGKALAWALGRLATASNGVEAKAVAALAEGGLDVRENAYGILVNLAARGLASPGLGDAMAARVQAEIERAKSGGSGLGEHACRVLAVLGDARTPALIQQVIEQDRFCDRFELQRLRKAVQEDGRDQESIKAVKAAWSTVFADALFVPKPVKAAEPVTAAKGAAKPSGVKPTVPQSPPPPSSAPTSPPHAPPAGHAAPPADDAMADDPEAAADDDAMDAAIDANGPPQPIDWAAFASGPEAEALPAPLKQLAGQLGPLLEQLSARAIRAPLADLSGQEFVGLLLQVLPQALPPQHVQMALSPHAMQCYKALVKFLIRTGLATKGQDLLDGIAMVRKELTNQIRQAGILNGPDFSDPDDKPAATPKA